MVTVTLVIAGCPAQVPASVLPGRAEVRPASDGQGLSFGEHEGRQVRTALHGGLVQAVRPVDQQRGGWPSGTGTVAMISGLVRSVVSA